MDCGAEVSLLRERLSRVNGVRELHFDIVQGRLSVEYAPEVVSGREITAAVEQAGMRCEAWRSAGQEARRDWVGMAAWASGALLASGMAVQVWRNGDGIAALLAHGHLEGGHGRALPAGAVWLYAGAVAAGAAGIVEKAWAAVRMVRADMNVLVLVSLGGAMALGEWTEAATLAFLYALAGRVERAGMQRARESIARLLAVAPAEASVVHGGHEHRMEVEAVPVGSLVRVRAGERIPCDGQVVEGESLVDQAPITGESVAVEKRSGDEVYAGTLNEGGTLVVRAAKPAQDTRLSRMLRMVEESAARKAPSERLVERFARRYTPVVLALALGVALLPPALGMGPWPRWLHQGMVVLLISCPCAFVISTPVTVVAALASAAREGVLIKGGAFLEAAGRMKALAMDRPGILTWGKPELARAVPLAGPAAGEITKWQQWRRREGGQAPFTPKLARAAGLAESTVAQLEEMAGQGWTLSAKQAGEDVALEGWCDRPRREAREAVAALRSRGVRSFVLLTGDPEPAARAAAEAAGVDEVHAELKPDEKEAQIDRLAARYGVTGMIGDCVADEEALRHAALGISVVLPGSETAQESSDVVIMGGGLDKVVFLVEHGQRAMRVIRQNITLALVLKAMFLAAAAMERATLWMAVAADMGATLAVTLNGLRLLRPTGHRKL